MFQDEMFEIARGVAACPYVPVCQSEFKAKGASKGQDWSLASVPSPDFVGANYRGLVIIAGNPGLAHRSIHYKNDERMFALQKRIAVGDAQAFKELMEFLPESMKSWPQMVDERGRSILDYDIRDVACVELVKCGTRPGRGDTRSLFRGTGILDRCWRTHTSRILDVLRPSHIVTLWKPLGRILDELGFVRVGLAFGTFNGRRSLPLSDKYAGARMPFDLYYGRSK